MEHDFKKKLEDMHNAFVHLVKHYRQARDIEKELLSIQKSKKDMRRGSWGLLLLLFNPEFRNFDALTKHYNNFLKRVGTSASYLPLIKGALIEKLDTVVSLKSKMSREEFEHELNYIIAVMKDTGFNKNPSFNNLIIRRVGEELAKNKIV